jgi:2-desacetyl-2-hydroxyethyl bacteriochlorophyllide A dehydrogenase
MSVNPARDKMQALVWEGARQMALKDMPLPVLAKDEVLIEVAYCGICGAELSGYLGHNALRKPPLVMGHEFSGTIVAMGEEATAHHPALELGARVTADPMVFDGTCVYCSQGQNHLCLNRSLVGAARPGAFARYVAVPGRVVFLLPQGVDMRMGAMVEPTACAVRIASLATGLNDGSVLIVGAGTIGLLALQVFRHRGAARVFVSDTNVERLAFAAELGAEVLNPLQVDVVQEVQSAVSGATGRDGVDIALDAVGKAVTRAQCVSAVHRGGQVLLSGLHEETSAMPVADMIRREITAQGTYCYTPGDFSEAIKLIDQAAVVFGDWVVDAPLSEGGAWFDALVDDPGGAIKVLLQPQ